VPPIYKLVYNPLWPETIVISPQTHFEAGQFDLSATSVQAALKRSRANQAHHWQGPNCLVICCFKMGCPTAGNQHTGGLGELWDFWGKQMKACQPGWALRCRRIFQVRSHFLFTWWPCLKLVNQYKSLRGIYYICIMMIIFVPLHFNNHDEAPWSHPKLGAYYGAGEELWSLDSGWKPNSLGDDFVWGFPDLSKPWFCSP